MQSQFINKAVFGLAVTPLLLGAAGAARADGHAALKYVGRIISR